MHSPNTTRININGLRRGIFFLSLLFIHISIFSAKAITEAEEVNHLPRPLNRIQNIHYGDVARNPLYVSYSKTLQLNPKKNIYLYQGTSVDEFVTIAEFIFDGLKIPKKSIVLAKKPYDRCRYEKVLAIHWNKISGWYAAQGLIMPGEQLCYLTVINSPQIKRGKRYRNLLVEPEENFEKSEDTEIKLIGNRSKNVNQGSGKNVVNKKN